MGSDEHETNATSERASSCGVKLNLVRDGVYTWAIWSNSEATIDELRRAKDHVVEITRELENEVPYATPPEPRNRRSRRG